MCWYCFISCVIFYSSWYIFKQGWKPKFLKIYIGKSVSLLSNIDKKHLFFIIITFFFYALNSIVNINHMNYYIVKNSDQNSAKSYVWGYRLIEPPLFKLLQYEIIVLGQLFAQGQPAPLSKSVLKVMFFFFTLASLKSWDQNSLKFICQKHDCHY